MFDGKRCGALSVRGESINILGTENGVLRDKAAAASLAFFIKSTCTLIHCHQSVMTFHYIIQQGKRTANYPVHVLPSK